MQNSTKVGPGTIGPSHKGDAKWHWLILLLIPFLARGVEGGDAGAVLDLARAFAASGESLQAFVTQPAHAYAFHHLIWFFFFLMEDRILSIFVSDRILADAILSMTSVAAGLAAVLLSYDYLKTLLSPARAAALTLTFFAGGYGVFIWAGGGPIECYMAALIAARMVLTRESTSIRDRTVVWLVLIDALLIMLKAYSLIFVLVAGTFLYKSATRKQLRSYTILLAPLLGMYALVKYQLWSPPPFYGYIDLFSFHYWERLFDQFFSIDDGMLTCLPVLLVLAACPKIMWPELAIKFSAIFVLTLLFSAFTFDSSLNGGRYIFPFLIILLPELAAGTKKLLDRWPSAVWTIPILVLAFIPFCDYRPLAIPHTEAQPVRTCAVDSHPVITSWKLLWNEHSDAPISFCMENRVFLIAARDARPTLGISRLDFLLSGGQTPEKYRGKIEDVYRILDRVGIGHLRLWRILRFSFYFFLLLFSFFVAMSVRKDERVSS